MESCTLADCTILRDGRCIEGRKGDCPNRVESEVFAAISERPATRVPGTDPDALGEVLHSGLPLELEEAREVASARRCHVVVLVGMPESGKTSLLARLHQQFLGGPIAGFGFAGSLTLPTFEELNWKSMVESGASNPMMDHSSRSNDNRFLHLTVREQGAGLRELLINDVSGETFPEAIKMKSVCEQLVGLSRADHVAVVVDGEALSDRARRHDHTAKARNFAQRVIQAGQIGHDTALHLVVTKDDILAKNSEAVEAALRLEKDWTGQFTAKVAAVNCWRVAARPRDGSYPTEERIAQLFRVWASSTHRYSSPKFVTRMASQGRSFVGFGRQHA